MTENEVNSALLSLCAQEKRYTKGQTLFHAGDFTEKLGLVLTGSVTVESNDGIGSAETLAAVAASWTFKFTANLLAISSRKNLHLAGRSFHTAPKTVRGRVMAYLNTVSLQTQSREFDIPFDRQQLADYLNVERTALSKELGKMQNDGLIRVKKCHFIIR